MLLSLGDQVRPGTYRFHSRFKYVVNFEHRGRLIAVVDEAIGAGPLNIVLRGLKLAQAQGTDEPAPSILKGLHHSAQGWFAGAWGGDPTLGKQPTRVPNPEGVESPISRAPPALLQISRNTVLFEGHRYHFTARHRYKSTLGLAATLQLRKAPLNRKNAMDAARRSRNRTARSVWSARSLLPLSIRRTRDDSASKLDALQTLRVAVHPQNMKAVDLRRFQRNLAIFGELLKADAPPKSLAFLLDGERCKSFRAGFERAFAKQITRGVREVFHGRLLQGIRQLKGCGPGLTPAGDDFIAGLLIGLHLLQKLHDPDVQATADAVFRAARGKNIFSNTFLDLARRGLLFGYLKDLLLALVAGSERAVRQASVKLFAVGATSGADLATGFFMTVAHFSGLASAVKVPEAVVHKIWLKRH